MKCCQRTKKEACKRLGEVADLSFMSKLIEELDDRLELKPESCNSKAIVNELLETQDKEKLQRWIYAIREALESAPKTADQWGGQWKAASALFYMTVRQLIDHPEMDDAQSEFVRKIVQLPNDDPQLPQTLGAIIAATLLGGILKFKGSGVDRKPEHVHLISKVPSMADDFETPIKLALFCAWFPAHESTPGYLDGSLSLTPRDEALLIANIKKARYQKYKTVAFIFEEHDLSIDTLTGIGDLFQVPLLWQPPQESKVLTEIFGMQPEALLEDIRLFWEIDTDASAQTNPPPSTQGEPSMPTTPSVSISVTTGEKSTVAVSSGDSSPIDQATQYTQTGINHAALDPLLAELKQEVASVNNPKLTGDLNEFEQQINSEKPDKTLIAKGLETIQQAAGYIQNGEKTITAAGKISAVLAPFLA